MKRNHLLAMSISMLIALFLAGCGSGGGKSNDADNNSETAAGSDDTSNGETGGEESSSESTLPAPGNIQASTGNLKNFISWPDVPGADSYTLYWSTTGGISKTTSDRIKNVSSTYTHRSLRLGETYYYSVVSVDTEGFESGLSDGVSVTEGQLSRIVFDDSGLESCVLGSGSETITQLTTLSCASNDIKDLSGIDNLVGVTSLYLQSNKIQDISLIGQITELKILLLASNQITDGVKQLLRLTDPTVISLSGNAGISCGELNQIIGAFGTSVVDPAEATDGVNCAAP